MVFLFVLDLRGLAQSKSNNNTFGVGKISINSLQGMSALAMLMS